MIQSPTEATVTKQELLFTRENVESIGQRFFNHVMHRHMQPGAAWTQAVEDEAQLVHHKLELMREGSMLWDWQGIQLDATRFGLELMVDHEAVYG